jgi:hypothetical protein
VIRIFFDIFIGQHRLEGPTSMIEIKHILDQKSIAGQGCEEEFVDPLPHTFADRNVLAWGRCAMASHNHSHVRQALT